MIRQAVALLTEEEVGLPEPKEQFGAPEPSFVRREPPSRGERVFDSRNRSFRIPLPHLQVGRL
ncbi:MAG: hypothetical protein GY937_17630 [bacterium]|nr:hypothetical protein [bacterium]